MGLQGTSLDWLQGIAEANVPIAICCFSCVFIFKHTFCLPGGTLLNALAGALFGLPIAIPLCALLSAIGASTCYLLSRTCGAPLIERWKLDAYVAPLRRRVEEAEANGTLVRALLSLRLVPFAPQWVLTLLSPHAGVPLVPLALTSGIGLLPYVTVTCSAGAALANALKAGDVSASSLVSPRAIALLCLGAAVVAFGPALLSLAGRCVGPRPPVLPLIEPSSLPTDAVEDCV